ncbi:hypothetical protein [Jannaschia seohaensis]|uniref:hypothetical protein n=1 Tax=Jannaschia seohaensis TaxID=475081 RepID=UPI001FE8E25B|nr:hypothetical protein [Jannaschia seohaensis]
MRRVVLVEDVAETRAWLRDVIRETFPGCEVDCAATMARGVRRWPRLAICWSST